MIKNGILLISFFLFFGANLAFSQVTEAEILKQAEKNYKSQLFVEASPGYLKLLALNPRDGFYNLRYGTCLLYNSENKSEAIKHLEFASKTEGISAEVFYFLGKAYQLNYRFDAALKSYTLFKSSPTYKPSIEMDVDKAISETKNGMKLLSSLNDILVYSKTEADEKEFYRRYNLEEIGGDIVSASNFQSKLDKKKNFISTMYYPANARIVFYASYGDVENSGLDIYYRTRKGDGTWGDAQRLPDLLNTKYDELYPFYDAKHEELYFSSNGHNSMGGFDVFKCSFSPESKKLGAVQNLDFPISSASDDLFFMVDSLGQKAYFASARQSQNHKIHVYEVLLQSKKSELIAIQGSISVPQGMNKKGEIEVYDAITKASIGIFETDENGNYMVVLPKSGSFEYKLKIENESFEAKVIVPKQTSLKVLKQELEIIQKEVGKELFVQNKFSESVENESDILASLINRKGELNPNSAEFSENEFTSSGNLEPLLTKVGMSNFSPMEAKEQLLSQLNKQQNLIHNTEDLSNKALAQVLAATEAIQGLQVNVKSLTTRAAESQNPALQENLYVQAAAKIKRIEELKVVANDWYRIADSLQKSAEKEKLELDRTAALQNDLSKVSKEPTSDEIQHLIELHEKDILLIQAISESTPKEVKRNEVISSLEKEKITKAELAKYQASVKKTDAEIAKLKVDLEAAKAKAKERIEIEIGVKEVERELVQQEVSRLEKQIKKEEGKLIELNTQLELIQNLDQMASPTKRLNLAEVKSKINATDDQNFRSLTAYVAEKVKDSKTSTEVIELEISEVEIPVDKTPELETIVQTESAWEANLSENYDKTQAEIEANSSLSPQEKITQKIASNENQVASWENELQQTNSALANTSSKSEQENLRNKAASLTSLIAENKSTQVKLKSELTELKKPASEEIVEVEIPVDKTPELETSIQTESAWEANLSENYTENQAEIEANSNLSQQEKLTQKIASNENQVANWENELQQTNSAIANTSSKSEQENLRNKAASLTNLIAKNKTAQAKLKSELAELKKPASEEIVEVEIPVDKTPELETIVQTESVWEANLSENYTENQAEIEANSNLSQQEKLTQKIASNENQVASWENELQQTNSALANSSSKSEQENLRNKAASLTNLIAENKTAQAKLNKELAELEKVAVEEIVEENTTFESSTYSDSKLKLLTETYENETKILLDNKVITQKEQVEKGIELEEKQLKSIKELKIELSEQLVNEPDNDELKTNLSKLDILESESESKLAEWKQTEVLEAKSNLNEIKILKKVDKNYEKDIAALEKSSSSEKSILLEKREREFQDKLTQQIQANEYLLTKKETPEILAENNYLADQIEASNKRIENRKLEIIPSEKEAIQNEAIESKTIENKAIENVVVETEVIESEISPIALRNEKGISEFEFSRAENELEKQSKINSLQNYKQVLSSEKISLEKFKKPSIQQQKRIGTITVELENIDRQMEGLNAQEFPSENELFVEKTEIENLQVEKASLSLALTDQSLSKKEKQELTQKINQNTEKQFNSSNEQTRKSVAENQALLTEKIELIDTKSVSSELSEEGNQILAKAAEISNKKNELENNKSIQKDPIELRKRLNEIEVEQTILVKKTEIYLNDQKQFQLNEKLGLPQISPLEISSLNQLENRNSLISSEILYLDSKILEKKKALEIASKKEKAALENEISSLEIELKSTRYLKLDVENKIVELKSTDRSPYNEEAINQEVSYVDELELAGSEAYNSFFNLITRANESKKNVISTKFKIEKLVDSIQILLESTTTDEQIYMSLLTSLESKKLELKNFELEFETNTKMANSFLEELNDVVKQNKFQNLFIRSVAPIVKSLVVANLLVLPSDGFAFNENKTTETKRLEVPIEATASSGLVYRVQVGAFAKPIPEERFNEFTPVSGEKLTNGITRYLAGYFNNQAAVLLAQKQIRAIGYADAFPVAYCDGKRISLAEARQLEASGACLPKGVNELMLDIAENSPEIVLDDTLKKAKNDVSAYNKAPNAAKATAVETKLGLFYTVQIGVYKTPVESNIVKNIEPLVTQRLANGLIRYSSGMFNSPESAQAKRKEAIARGISDAFITAYFNGERISLQQASELLAEKGTSILQENDEKANKIVVESDLKRIEQEVKSIAVSKEVNLEVKIKDTPLLLVSKISYSEFPTEILRRYNDKGLFYYDNKDLKIKSIMYKNSDYLPSIYNFKHALDTILVSDLSSKLQDEYYLVKVEIEGETIPGDFVNWLIRMPYQRSVELKDSKIIFQIPFVASEMEANLLRQKISSFKLECSYEKVVKKETLTK